MLAFYPDPLVADGKFHRVKVTVSRSGAHVRARQGVLGADLAVGLVPFQPTTLRTFDAADTLRVGRPKRWVVVRPVGATTGILLACADGDGPTRVVGMQFGGRVGLFLRVDNFDASYRRMVDAGVVFVSTPRVESYGTVAVFLDCEGNRWDLLGHQ